QYPTGSVDKAGTALAQTCPPWRTRCAFWASAEPRECCDRALSRRRLCARAAYRAGGVGYIGDAAPCAKQDRPGRGTGAVSLVKRLISAAGLTTTRCPSKPACCPVHRRCGAINVRVSQSLDEQPGGAIPPGHP